MDTLQKIKTRFGLDGIDTNPIRIPEVKREALAAIFADLRFRRGVEIGVHKGYFSGVLCSVNRGLKLTSIDVWKNEEIYLEAIRHLRSFNCELIRLPSVPASTLFEDGSLDFVYIDGDHAKEPFKADLHAWERKVRPGGIVAGHDYKVADHTAAARRCKVLEVVDEYVAKHGINPFFVIGEKFVSWPTWFWIKKEEASEWR